MRPQIPKNVQILLYTTLELKSIDLLQSAKSPKKTMFGQRLEDYPIDHEKGVPMMLKKLTEYFYKRKEAFQTQFLFRVPPSRQEFQEFDLAIATEGLDAIERIKDPTLVAGNFC